MGEFARMHSHDDLHAGGNPGVPPDVPENPGERSQLDFEIGFYGGILQRDPSYVDVLRVMSNNLTAKGDHHASLEFDRRLAQLCPEDRIAHYNLACSYSLLGRIEPALKALESALTLGFDDFGYLQEDRDLETVRKDPRFQELLATHGVR